MLYVRLTVLGVLGFSLVNASKENLPDDPPNFYFLATPAVQQLEQNLIPPHTLKHHRHQLRMRLMSSHRTSCTAPSTGKQRRQLELKLAEIEQILTQKT